VATAIFNKIDNQHAALSGELGFDNVVLLWKEGKKIIDEMSVVKLDCSELKKSGSTVMVLMLAYARYCRNQKKQLSFVNLPDYILEVAHVYGVDKFLVLNNG